ncbi:MAG: hypothetical protein ACJ79R_11205 [Anaeromyxobacteraceae bacterium]
MRLSPTRVIVRIALLAVGGASMVWRAVETRSASRGIGGGDALLGSRLALVWALVGALALLTAAAAALSLRPRGRGKTLRLGDVPRADDPPTATGPAKTAAGAAQDRPGHGGGQSN